MIRIHDHVRLEHRLHGRDIAQVSSVGEDGRLVVRVDNAGISYHESVEDGTTTLLCGELTCTADAVAFTSTGRPLCEVCSAEHDSAVLDVRPELTALVVCVCGEALDAGRIDGLWTMGDPPIACEYRTCAHCGSTRAYMARNRIDGRPVRLFEYPGASAVQGEWDNILDALDAPAFHLAELRRGSVVLARAFTTHGDTYGWRLMPPERE